MDCLNQDMQDVRIYRIVRTGVFAFALIVVMALTYGCVTTASPDIPEAERRASALNKAIMCPVCPGESIDQSQNPLAVQMRAIVDEKLEEGWDEGRIKDFFVERYGPSVSAGAAVCGLRNRGVDSAASRVRAGAGVPVSHASLDEENLGTGQ